MENEHFAPSEEGRPGYLKNDDILTLNERKLYRKSDNKEGFSEEQK